MVTSFKNVEQNLKKWDVATVASVLPIKENLQKVRKIQTTILVIK